LRAAWIHGTAERVPIAKLHFSWLADVRHTNRTTCANFRSSKTASRILPRGMRVHDDGKAYCGSAQIVHD
jgi:hypothetical protein